MEFQNQIPTYDVLRPEYVGRYVVLDPYMTGKARFGICEGTKECVLKPANRAKLTEDISASSNVLYTDTIIRNIIPGSYIIINKVYYEVSSSDEINKTIYLVNNIGTNIESNTEISLFSVPVSISNEYVCTSIEFGVTSIEVNGISLSITESMTIQDVIDYYYDSTPVTNFGNTLYFYGTGWSESTTYNTYTKLPIKSKMVVCTGKHKVCRGDDILLYNSDIRGNCTVYVKEAYEQNTDTGTKYVLIVSGLDNEYSYSQLRAYPAYFSRKLQLKNIRPSIVDICNGTTFGDESEVVKGIRLYTDDTQNSLIFKNDTVIPNLYSEPCDLWLTNVIHGKIKQNLPKITFICDDNGIFQGSISTRLRSTDIFNFNFKFSSISIVSFMDYTTGEVIATSNESGLISSRINNISITIHSCSNAVISLESFYYNGSNSNKLEYYFVCREENNSRVEVNGLHLNQVFKSYKELLAIIGSSKASEGRIAL